MNKYRSHVLNRLVYTFRNMLMLIQIMSLYLITMDNKAFESSNTVPPGADSTKQLHQEFVNKNIHLLGHPTKDDLLGHPTKDDIAESKDTIVYSKPILKLLQSNK